MLNHRTQTAQALIAPPAEELAHLLDMALKGELPRLQKRIIQLAQVDSMHQPFANALCALIKNYEEEQIVALLQGQPQNGLVPTRADSLWKP